MTTTALSDTQICIAALSARRTAAQLETVARPVLRMLGLNVTDYQLLVALIDLPDRTSRAGGLAPRMAVTTGGVSRAVDRAVLAGLVTRTRSEDDGRGQVVTITPYGADRLAAAVPALAAALRSHLEAVQG